MKIGLFAGLALSASLMAAGAASATTKVFDYFSGASVVASGSFTYATGTTGVVTPANLTDFNADVLGVHYDYADFVAQSPAWLAYDTSANDFLLYDNGGGVYLSLADVATGTGFFMISLPSGGDGGVKLVVTQLNDQATHIATWDRVVITGVPEPKGWALMLLGVGALGGALRGRRKSLA